MGPAWIVVGLIAGLSVLGCVELRRRYRLDWRAWTGLLFGEFLTLFCIAWCAASVAEVVGSLLRSPGLEGAEDEAVARVVRQQIDIGLDVVTDGEFRRTMFLDSFWRGVEVVR